MEQHKPPLRLAVRQLVERVMRGGDIDNRYADSATAMLDGARAHRMLQRQMGSEYQKEVSLRREALAGEGLPVLLYGRADGLIIEEDGRVIIDEIKTTSRPLAALMAQRELHLGQAKCYAWMLLGDMEAPPAKATIQLTYYGIETKEIQRIPVEFTAEELCAHVEALLAAYAVWLRMERDWAVLRDESIRGTGFPFAEYRAGQRKLAVAAYAAIESGRRLYAQAPTGTGKTMAALFPSIKALAEGKAEKIFYLTAKTVTRAVAEDALRLLQGGGLRIKSLTLRAKEKTCFCEEVNCNPEDCPYARGHFDRVNDALLDILANTDIISPEILLAYAKKHAVCPHEFALDASEWADVVIGDYNHLFDPTAALRRYFSEGGEYVLLIDEAHNLPDRVRDMYTAALHKSDFSGLSRALKEKGAPTARLKKAAGAINKYFLAERKESEEPIRTQRELEEEAVRLAEAFVKEAEAWMTEARGAAHPLYPQVLELFFACSFFAMMAAGYGEHYASLTELRRGDVVRTLFCLDPAGIIAQRLRLCKAAVLFSATMTPLPYYRELMGGDELDGMLELASPFAEERLLLLAHTGISTKYADRPGSVEPVAEAIAQAAAWRRGNYMIYFPSYAYMEEVYVCFTGRYPETRVLLQHSGMDEPSRSAFLAQFRDDNEETLLGFCVMGGIFAEGIDLVGERLVGAVIVGVGLPKITFRQDLIRAYYNEKNGQGFDYAYVYPGMNKVLQAAGRVIRSETDSGVALLIDSRFGTIRYRELFPAHWSGMRFVRDAEELRAMLKRKEQFPTDN